jgi:hypothetical protein
MVNNPAHLLGVYLYTDFVIDRGFRFGSRLASALPRPADITRRLVLARSMSALAVAFADVRQFEASKECQGGAFSSGFSSGFDVRRCDLVVRKIGNNAELRIQLPQ